MRTFRALTTAALLVGTGLLATSAPAWADDSEVLAEKLRLEEEIKKLAARNAWAGVETKYEELVRLKTPLSFEDHFLGAQSARFLGKTFEMYSRLDAAKQLEAKPEIVMEMEGIENRYGRVEIVGHPRKRHPLVVNAMPFAPDERKSIEWAQTVLTATGSFRGMLPIDVEYSIADQAFTAKTGPDWQVLDIAKAKVDATGGGEQLSVIRYAGPILTAGYAFTASPEPLDAPKGDPALLQPNSMSGSGLGAEIGAEVGFSLNFGVAATVGYNGLWGTTDQLHGFKGALLAAYRPGEFRFAAGPTYGLYAGKGEGVSDYWYLGTDEEEFREDYDNTQVQYQGRSLVGGFQMSAGYGLLDVGSKLRGVVEVGGSWEHDGVRSYGTVGLRVGIVPLIERFEG